MKFPLNAVRVHDEKRSVYSGNISLPQKPLNLFVFKNLFGCMKAILFCVIDNPSLVLPTL